MNGLMSLIDQMLARESNKALKEKWKPYIDNIDLFFDLFEAPADQFIMGATDKIVKRELRKMKIPFMTDSEGNIFNLNNKNRPLLSAHMDTVQRAKDITQAFDIGFNIDKELIFRGESCIGADDKVGVFIALEQLRRTPTVNFLFTTGEESGALGSKYFVKDPKNVEKLQKNVSYGLILDRKNGYDIIGESNSYCTKEFQETLKDLGYGYSPTWGSLSDANTLKVYFSCVNLSVGYYNPHTDNEYVNIEEMENCQDFIAEILETVTSRYEPYKYKSYSYPAKPKENVYSFPKESKDSTSKDPAKCTFCQRTVDRTSSAPRMSFVEHHGTGKSHFQHVCPSCYKGFMEGFLTKQKNHRRSA